MKIRYWLSATVLLVLAWVMLYEVPQQSRYLPPSPINQNPGDVGLEFQSFTLQPKDTDITLAGWWMPAENASASLVFIHGGGSNRHSQFFKSLDFYAAMVSRGVSVAVVDLRNHGASGSDALGLQFGRTEKWDALALIDWTRAKTPDLPLYAMGISMGGATLIHAAATGAQMDGLILLDPLLDTRSVITRGAWVETGLPPTLFSVSAWAATIWHGMPSGEEQSLELGIQLPGPILLLQDPGDPVTRADYARQLSAKNPAIAYWEAPSVSAEDQKKLAWRGRWGSHVAAFELYPELVLEQIMAFITPTP